MKSLSLIAICLLFVSCSRVTIETSHDDAARFESYHSFALDANPPELGPLSKQGLENSLRERLQARGLKQVPAHKADLLVVCSVYTEQKPVVSTVGGKVYLSSNFGPYLGANGVIQAPHFAEHTHGSLIIDFIDGRSRQVVFRGIGGARLNVEEKNAAAIQAVVTKIVGAVPRLNEK